MRITPCRNRLPLGLSPMCTLQGTRANEGDEPESGTGTALASRPQTRFTIHTEKEFYRRKKSSVIVRHVSGDRIIAMLEIVSQRRTRLNRYSTRVQPQRIPVKHFR